MERSQLVIVEHTCYAECFQKISQCHHSRAGGLPIEHLRIVGATGAGKSTLLKDYCDHHPPYDTEDRTIVPVVYAAIPSWPTPRAIAGEMLHALRSPLWNKGDVHERTKQLITLIPAAGVELFLLDEMQHLVDRGRQRTHERCTDLLKEIVDASGVPFVFAGLERIETLGAVNDQFRRRASATAEMPALNPESDVDQSELLGMFIEAGETLGVGGVVEAMAPDFGRRLGYATNGTFGYLIKLVAQLKRRGEPLSAGPATLADVFREVIWCKAPNSRNPFAPEFIFTPLTASGEPFAPVEVASGRSVR